MTALIVQVSAIVILRCVNNEDNSWILTTYTTKPRKFRHSDHHQYVFNIQYCMFACLATQNCIESCLLLQVKLVIQMFDEV